MISPKNLAVFSVSAGYTVSDSRTEANDKSGSLLVKCIEEVGHWRDRSRVNAGSNSPVT